MHINICIKKRGKMKKNKVKPAYWMMDQYLKIKIVKLTKRAIDPHRVSTIITLHLSDLSTSPLEKNLLPKDDNHGNENFHHHLGGDGDENDQVDSGEFKIIDDIGDVTPCDGDEILEISKQQKQKRIIEWRKFFFFSSLASFAMIFS